MKEQGALNGAGAALLVTAESTARVVGAIARALPDHEAAIRHELDWLKKATDHYRDVEAELNAAQERKIRAYHRP